MLAVSGIMHRYVVRSLLTEWCVAPGKIPDTQYGFYPGCSILQTKFTLWHPHSMLHARANPTYHQGCMPKFLLLSKPVTPYKGCTMITSPAYMHACAYVVRNKGHLRL